MSFHHSSGSSNSFYHLVVLFELVLIMRLQLVSTSLLCSLNCGSSDSPIILVHSSLVLQRLMLCHVLLLFLLLFHLFFLFFVLLLYLFFLLIFHLFFLLIFLLFFHPFFLLFPLLLLSGCPTPSFALAEMPPP